MRIYVQLRGAELKRGGKRTHSAGLRSCDEQVRQRDSIGPPNHPTVLSAFVTRPREV